MGAFLEGRQKYGGRRYVRRLLAKQVEKLFYRLDRRALLAAFRNVGIKEGDKVFVHASMNRMGYIEGGAETVIRALMEAVGTAGSILMPSFPMTGSMKSYLDSGEVFDVRKTPSQVGVLSETFRRWEGVQRSLHPTASCTGWGRDAEYFLRDHHRSLTAFGDETPYGRAAQRNDTYILMMETHVMSVMHHLQERVDFPNLFLPGVKEVPVIGWDGKQEMVSTRVMRPRTPYFVAIPSSRPNTCDWITITDFSLIFPQRHFGELKQMGYVFDGYPPLWTRREQMERAGHLRTMKLGKGEIGLVQIGGFLRELEPELRELIQRFSHYYEGDMVDKIDALNLPIP